MNLKPVKIKAGLYRIETPEGDVVIERHRNASTWNRHSAGYHWNLTLPGNRCAEPINHASMKDAIEHHLGE